MSNKKDLDPRVERSRKWMKDALLELIDEKGYEKVTITDITDRAGLSRPTFYLHYKSKDELLVDHLGAIFEGILDEFYQHRQNGNIEDPGYVAMTKVFIEIANHIDLFKTMIVAGADRILLERTYLRSLVYLKELANRCGQTISKEIIELCAQFLAGAFVSLVIKWIQNEIPQSPEKMGKFYREATKPLLINAICNGELGYIFD